METVRKSPQHWASGEPSIATADATGLASAVGDGTARITATAGSASAGADVLVVTSRGALVELYEATEGPSWANSTGWLGTGPLADWYGVTTNEDGRHVVGLNLAGNSLGGALPPSMRNLIELETLDLRETDLCAPTDDDFRLARAGGTVIVQYNKMLETNSESDAPVVVLGGAGTPWRSTIELCIPQPQDEIPLIDSNV